LALNKSERN